MDADGELDLKLPRTNKFLMACHCSRTISAIHQLMIDGTSLLQTVSVRTTSNPANKREDASGLLVRDSSHQQSISAQPQFFPKILLLTVLALNSSQLPSVLLHANGTKLEPSIHHQLFHISVFPSQEFKQLQLVLVNALHNTFSLFATVSMIVNGKSVPTVLVFQSPPR